MDDRYGADGAHDLCSSKGHCVKYYSGTAPRLYVALRLVLRYACRENESIKDVG